MKPEPYLVVNGIELVNGTRTERYISTSNVPGFSTAPNCGCAELGTFTSISADPAPWYVATDAASTEFLGLHDLQVSWSSPNTRNVLDASYASALGRARLRGRSAAITATLFASSARGMAFGKRWVAEVLQSATACDDNDLFDVCFLPACPSPSLTIAQRAAYFRNLVRAGVTDGPIFTSAGVPGQYATKVAFTITSELPHLFGSEEEILAPVALGDTRRKAVQVDVPDWPSDAALRLSVSAGSPNPVTNLRVSVTPTVLGACSPIEDAAMFAAPNASGTFATLVGGPALSVVTANGFTHMPMTGMRYFAPCNFTNNGTGTSNNALAGNDIAGSIISVYCELTSTKRVFFISSTMTNDHLGVAFSSTSCDYRYRQGVTNVNGTINFADVGAGMRYMQLRIDNSTDPDLVSVWTSADGVTWTKIAEQTQTSALTGITVGTANQICSVNSDFASGGAPIALQKLVWVKWTNLAGTITLVDLDARVADPFDHFNLIDRNNVRWQFDSTNAAGVVFVDRPLLRLHPSGVTTGYVEWADDPTHDFAAGDSFTSFIAIRPISGNGVAFGKKGTGLAATAGWSIDIVAGPAGNTIISDGTTQITAAGPAVAPGRMNALVLRRKGTATKQLTSTQQAVTGTTVTDTSVNTLANALPTRIGRRSTGTADVFAGGSVYAAGIWRRELSAAEIGWLAARIMGDDTPRSGNPCSEFFIRELPAGSRLDIDGVTRVVQVVEVSSGRVLSQVGVIDLDESSNPTVPVVKGCATACVEFEGVNATYNADTKVSAYKSERDL